MGKQAKPKPASAKGTQKKHNQKTRWMNTKKKGTIWESYTVRYKDKEGNEQEYTKDVIIPPKTQYDMFDVQNMDPDRAQSPFDSMHLDWVEEIMQYAADYNAKIGKINLPNGTYLYRVYIGGNVNVPKWKLLEVESSRLLTLARKAPKKQRGPNGNSNTRRERTSSTNSSDSITVATSPDKESVG